MTTLADFSIYFRVWENPTIEVYFLLLTPMRRSVEDIEIDLIIKSPLGGEHKFCHAKIDLFQPRPPYVTLFAWDLHIFYMSCHVMQNPPSGEKR